MRDPYEVLQVDRKADAEDIKRAYRKLAKELHPDINPGNEAVEKRFKEVSQAYSILGDPEKRKLFDSGQIDANGQQSGWPGGFSRGGPGGGSGGGFNPFEAGDDINLNDIISDLFGGGRRQARSTRRKGADISYSVAVDFLEAAAGTTKRVKLADGKTIDFKIPAGSEDGQTLRLKGKGKAGLGGASPGDALVELKVQAHKHFKRSGQNILLDLPVTLQEALLGANVPVPTIHGKVSMKIPAGSNNGTSLRLKGKGIPARAGTEAGDQLVTLRIVLPKNRTGR